MIDQMQADTDAGLLAYIADCPEEFRIVLAITQRYGLRRS